MALLESGVEPVVLGLALGLLAYAHQPPRSGLERATERVREGAELSGVSGTPTFLINGRRHYGAYDVATLSAAVHAAGARATLATHAVVPAIVRRDMRRSTPCGDRIEGDRGRQAFARAGSARRSRRCRRATRARRVSRHVRRPAVARG